MEAPFRTEHFARLDESPDTEFYSFPRKVVHIDDAAIATVKQVFREVLPAHGVVLDDGLVRVGDAATLTAAELTPQPST